MFVAVLADKTEGPLSSVYKFDAKFDILNQNTVNEKNVKIFFRPVCTESFQERVEKIDWTQKNLRKAAIMLFIIQ